MVIWTEMCCKLIARINDKVFMSHYVMAKQFALKSSYAYKYNDEDWASVSDSNIEYRTGSRGYREQESVGGGPLLTHWQALPHSLKEHMGYLNTTFLQTTEFEFPYTLARASGCLSILYLVLNCIIPGPKIVNRNTLVAVNAIIVEQSLANLSSFRCKTATVTVTSRKRRRTNAKRTPTAT